MDVEKEVLRYVEISDARHAVELDSLVSLLTSNGITETEAEALIAFVPMGFAHALLSEAGMKLPESFEIRDCHTGASARGLLKDEPVFEAAKALARRMLRDPATKQQAAKVVGQSAEWAVARQLCPDGQDFASCGLTEPLLMRLPIDYLSKRKSRRNWRFWK